MGEGTRSIDGRPSLSSILFIAIIVALGSPTLPGLFSGLTLLKDLLTLQ